MRKYLNKDTTSIDSSLVLLALVEMIIFLDDFHKAFVIYSAPDLGNGRWAQLLFQLYNLMLGGVERTRMVFPRAGVNEIEAYDSRAQVL
jgi:hypothetical protein